jgi:hypothetical protein
MNLSEVRAKYPQYKDLSDEQLARGLHSKFYSDMPYDQFAAKVGLKAETPKPEPKGDPTAGERANAAVGGVNRGIAGLLGLPMNTAENIVNLGIAAYNTALQRGGESTPPVQGTIGGSQWIASQMQKGGVNTQNPRPDDTASQMLHTGGMIMGSGGRRAAVPAVAGATAEQVLGPEWIGPASMTPAAVSQAASAVKTAVANPQTVKSNLETFKEAGTRPDVAQATDSNFFRGLTNVVARVPGGQGVIAKFREMEQKSLANTAKTGVSAETAGRAIQKGITGEGGFLERSRAQWQALDQKVADKIGGPYNIPPVNTQKAFDDLVAPVAGAEATSAAIANPKLAAMRESFMKDTVGNLGAVPYDAMRQLRTKVGAMLDDSLVTGVPGGELKKLYGALSKDLEAGAKAVGAESEFMRQQTYYKARMERIENTLDKVLGKGTPEEVFKAVAPTDVDSVNKIRRVMRSLNPEDRQVVSEAVVNRLGRASPGKQTLDSDFSSETFLTNWNRINDSAKAQLFPNPEVRSRLDAIAKVSSDIREGKTPFGNPSGTGAAVTAVSIYGSPVASLATMNPTPIAVAGALVAGANIGARMLTSPKVIDWLAKAPKSTTPEQMTAHLSRLAVIYNESKDSALKAELADYLSSVK